ncbi:hypothetical protein Acr_00g0037510 [Actinidia rufa]|uniref:Uncharacterized protein n=1 Tax=Actinidia rufa TaxID=165716 RepID=A0A7J0DGV1_9ERIC|nr:hypothetical protein Acr_00g0037510 [Actinidia rufa]
MTEFRDPERATASEKGSGKDPDGEISMIGPGASDWSGFGGLGLEGIMGREDSDGEGQSGVMSGDKVGEGENIGGFGRSASAAEIVDVGKASEAEQLMRTITITITIPKCDLAEAIKW